MTQYTACKIAIVGARPRRVLTGSWTSVLKLKARMEESRIGWRLEKSSDACDERMSTGLEGGDAKLGTAGCGADAIAVGRKGMGGEMGTLVKVDNSANGCRYRKLQGRRN